MFFRAKGIMVVFLVIGLVLIAPLARAVKVGMEVKF